MLGVGFNTYTLTVASDDLLIRETEAAIQADIGGFRSLYKVAGRKAVIEAVNERIQTINNDFLYYLKDEGDTFLAGNLQTWPKDDFALIKNGVLDITVKLRKPNLSSEQIDTSSIVNSSSNSVNQTYSSAEPERAVAMVMEFNNKDSLLVARSVKDIELAVALAQTSSWVMIVILCVVAVISLGVAYYVVSRINKISETADDIIATGDLSDRLHVDSNWDDLSKLTVALNLMLDKIEQSVKAISSVSDNIAHDLRTPLTRLKSHIEEIKDEEERYTLIEECNTLLAIFNSLLRISDIEHSNKKSEFKRINLSDVVDDAIDLYQPLTESKEIGLHYKSPANIYFLGDKDLLFQAFANVLDNAIKFTPEHGAINVLLKKTDDAVTFSIEDTGTGVDDASLSKLTQRFFRADKSRTSSGNGLGLALVNAIVTLHDGEISFGKSTIRDSNGLKCTFTFPSSIED